MIKVRETVRVRSGIRGLGFGLRSGVVTPRVLLQTASHRPNTKISNTRNPYLFAVTETNFVQYISSNS